MPNTAHSSTRYVGRFAPSPTGPLHLGSLLAALASYLDARHQQGKWLVRIEDIDPPREQPGAALEILKTLEAHGLYWDDRVRYQSQHIEEYREATNRLVTEHKAYYCSCSRLQLREHHIYPGTCRMQTKLPSQPAAIRVIAQGQLDFTDRIQGPQHHDLTKDIGDFVIFRKDELPAYQLATALDDQWQGITHVVRGVDLLDSTPRQMYLHKTFKLMPPSYAHIPVLSTPGGQKLSKQNLAKPLDCTRCKENLFYALHWLNQHPPKDLAQQPIDAILDWGIKHWEISSIAPISSIQLDNSLF